MDAEVNKKAVSKNYIEWILAQRSLSGAKTHRDSFIFFGPGQLCD